MRPDAGVERPAVGVGAIVLLVAGAAACAGGSAPEPTSTDVHRYDRLFVLPVLSLGELREVRPAARQSLVLSFSFLADTLILLEDETGAGQGTEPNREQGVPSVRADTLYGPRCDFELVKQRLAPERSRRLRRGDVYALCADLGYRRGPSAGGKRQVASAVGQLWSGRRDSVVWTDSASVSARIEMSRLTPDTLASLITEAVLRLEERYP